MFEEEKSLVVEHDSSGKIVPNWVYFGQGEDFKEQHSRNQAIKTGLNEAMLLLPINEALLSS